MPRLDLIALGIREGMRRALVSASAAVMRREVRDAAKGELDVALWASRWYDALRPLVDVIMHAAVDRERDTFGHYDPSMYAHEYTSALSRNLARTSYRNAMRILDKARDEGAGVDETARALRRELPEINRARSELIARTELHTAAEAASYQHATASPAVSRAIWRHSGKSDARHEHVVLDGDTRPLGVPWPTGEYFPSKPNCGCWLDYV